MMKTTMIAALSALFMGQALAQTTGESPWLVRLRATHIDMANKDGTGQDLTVNNKTFGELDVSYFFTPNVAAELVLTTPQRQEVRQAGVPIGTFKHLPPTLLLQYHFTGMGHFKPYVGAGVNYTRISDVALAGGAATLENDSWGGAVQVGLDLPLTRHWWLNLDVKKVQIRSDVRVGGSSLGQLKLDPTLASVGIGYRF